MPAVKYDFSIQQGSSFKLTIIYKDSDQNVIDLSNYCARIVWKTNLGITQSFYSGTTNSNYKFSLDGPNGKLVLEFPAVVTNDFSFSNAKYDLELKSNDIIYTNGGEYATRIAYGTITINKRYSQSNTNIDCNI